MVVKKLFALIHVITAISYLNYCEVFQTDGIWGEWNYFVAKKFNALISTL